MTDRLDSDRAVSTTLGYVLTLSIVTLLVTGLLIAGGQYVGSQRERVVRSELGVLSERLVSGIQSADRMAMAAGSSGEVVVVTKLPEKAGKTPYTVELVRDGGDTVLRLSTSQPDVTVETVVNNRTAVSLSTVSGGDVRIEYRGDRLEVSRD
ncbi:MAG: hypothetical protein ABEJ28_09385 [Salinigranum sp.]